MLKKSIFLGAALAISLPLWVPSAQAMTVYKIDIEKSFIKASANDAIIELKMIGESLVVVTVPNDGFYGLKVGDHIIKVNGDDIHTTDAFISSLDSSTDNLANFEIERDNTSLKLVVPKKGYSWFQ